MPDQAQTAAGTTKISTARSDRPRRRPGRSPRTRISDMAAKLISLIATIVVAVLAVHIVFVMFEANTSNAIVRAVGDRAHDLAWQFRDMFQPDDPKAAVLVNYGIAAVVYLIVGRALAGLVRRAG